MRIRWNSPVGPKALGLAWLRHHGIDPKEVAELVLDPNIAEVHRYEIDTTGHYFLRDGEVARRVPLIVPLSQTEYESVRTLPREHEAQFDPDRDYSDLRGRHS